MGIESKHYFILEKTDGVAKLIDLDGLNARVLKECRKETLVGV